MVLFLSESIMMGVVPGSAVVARLMVLMKAKLAALYTETDFPV